MALSIIPHVLYIISLITNINQGVFAFTAYPSFFHQNNNRCTLQIIAANKPSALQLSSNNNNDDGYNNVNIAGVSVSPNGFLVILQSKLQLNDPKQQIAFPIALTTPPPPYSNTTSSLQLPSLFQENYDQLSVTTPEALTFLQLLNGVDMATPILSPDTLSLVCVWYALLTEDILEIDDNECSIIDDNGGGCLVEDELGLSSSIEEDGELQSSEEEFQEALNYIRSMIKTTLPSDDGDTSSSSTSASRYINASSWQRARVQLPRAWLHGVRIEMMNTDGTLSSTTSNDGNNNNNSHIGQVPLQYTLQCSVDDGTKMLEIPLYSISSLSYYNDSQSSSIQQKKINISNEILQEITHNYNVESSASFISLALYFRYNKSSSGGDNDRPTLKVSTGLLNQLVEIQQDNDKKKEATGRYCWTLPNTGDGSDDDIDTIIQKEGLPLYRPIASIKEEDKRVLSHLKEQNFGKDDISPSSSSSSSSNNNNTTNTTNSSSYRSTSQGTESSGGIGNVKKSLSLEQQATQEKLKAAWKIAQQRQDEGALEKIQLAMEELELEVISKNNNPEEDSEYDEMINELREEQSTLDKIQQAMQDKDSSEDIPERDYSGQEDVVGLISDLEEATTSASAVDDESSVIEEEDDDE